MNLLPVEEALARILAHVPPVTAETVGLGDAVGRVLAAHVVASHDQPPFPASAMDGYAIRAADLETVTAFKLIGTSQAGAAFAGSVGAAETVRIFTGAPLPEGADTVIMQEEATAAAGRVWFKTEAAPGKNIRPRGNDFAGGQPLLAIGLRIDPFSLGLAATANVSTLSVARRPHIGIVSTGDELVVPGTLLGADQIVASNASALSALLAPYAEKITDYGIARDTVVEHRRLFEMALDDGIDILVTTGGASVGDHDIVQPVLAELGVDIDFWRINMRPGKPLMVGTRGRALVFGLPGNPVSALVTATIFIKPALRLWLGHAGRPPLLLPLAAPTPPNTARRHFMRARLVNTAEQTAVLPIAQTDSGHTSSLAAADVLFVQPEHDPGQPAGTIVEVIRLADF